MNRSGLIIICLMIFLQAASLASPTNTSDTITASVVDMGGGTSESTNYSMFGRVGDYLPSTPSTGIGFTLGEGFLRSIFYGAILPPFILAIHPSSGYNDSSVYVTISGGNFRKGGVTTVELRLTNEPTVTATGVAVGDDASSITCRLNLRGAKPGFRTVFVSSDGSEATLPSVSEAPLPSVFEVKEAEFKIIGTPLNFPNPFKPGISDVTIKYQLSRDSSAKLLIYNINGKPVKTYDFSLGRTGGAAGDNLITWDGKDNFGKIVANGPYYYFLIVDGKVIGHGEMAAFQ